MKSMSASEMQAKDKEEKDKGEKIIREEEDEVWWLTWHGRSSAQEESFEQHRAGHTGSLCLTPTPPLARPSSLGGGA